MSLILYGTEGCHLCDEAELLIRQVLTEGQTLSLVDIVDDDDLYERYQFTIPVLKNSSTGAIINWPFTTKDVQALFAEG